ncbi:TetR/AcrR family transcriptional regulator [Ramlibacter sp. Leaf400]|uniref:TetR/AcrR family transcriptional regulator n=1 Tax=Ramlibacter sp. Leaf400 TaxID=1736365 RepID=UPI0006FCE289|nr:TetR/AcrR family transcriptional regulator [Ramlibacter sp. Leaf400]KQT12254.1 TetR family transcriptional regulator [Ramlibacter sp. Leaf400]
MSTVAARPSFKEQMLAAREEAIIQNVNRLLAEKGFDAMTVDEVAAAVGIAKASLYKHFPSKEDLAAAAMVRVMRRAQQFLSEIDPQLPVQDKLKALVRWTLQVRLAGQMPSLPSQNSSLRAALTSNRDYIDAMTRISEQLGVWIDAGQREGTIDARLPREAVLYTLYARACDPVVEFLRSGGQHDDEEIVELVVGTCFNGLSAR